MTELFMRFPEFKTKAVTLSYDDGTGFDREMISILNKYGIKCTFNLNSNFLGDAYHVSEKEINTLYKGHEIAVHTYTHPHLENLDAGEIAFQIIKDRECLENITGSVVKGMAYPHGLYDERIPGTVKECGINYARTIMHTYNFSLPRDFLKWNPTCHHSYEKIDDLIEKFFEKDDLEHPWNIRPKVFYLWGHSYEFANCFGILEELCKKLAGKDTTWYATNGDIFEYVSGYKKLNFSVNGRIVHNPTAIDIYAFSNGKNILIPSGKTVVIGN